MRIACLALAIIGALGAAVCTLCYGAVAAGGADVGDTGAAAGGTLMFAMSGLQFILGLAGGIMVMSKTGKGEKGTIGAVLLVLCFILSIVTFNWLSVIFFLLAAIFGFIAKPVVADTGAAAAAPMQEPPTT